MVKEETKEREARWQKAWNDKKLFLAEPSEKKKFFGTFPYPYVNGLPHVGHIFTMMRVEAFARYKRAQGYNVLFPQGWHATGVPITAAARRVAEHDQKQIQILRDNGVAESEIDQFANPEHWIHYFSPRYREDVQRAGLSIDWRREFITTNLNPQYDAFIQWQFLKLREKKYVQQGSHPVVWCPKDQAPVGDHDRSVGEGETPQEFTLLKFPLVHTPTTMLIAATLRPETVFGQTNLWIGKDTEYVEANVNGEHWIISQPCVEKLITQGHKVAVEKKIIGKTLIGQYVKAPGTNREIPILPSHFCSPEKGTGIVTSVPSDAPDDWIGIHDLQTAKDDPMHELAMQLQPIPIIRASDLGDMAAPTICEQMGIKNQHDRIKLEEAKKIVYKKGFYEGVMIAGPHKGMTVQKAKDLIKHELLARKQAVLFYELTGKVVCRCQTPSVVKIVTDQWFIKYGDKDWKILTTKALAGCALYPEKVRQQFEYVIDWLDDWACTREYGIGSRLPWDNRWLIESLSDSTIYMAYYTISHKIKHVPQEFLTEQFFDYVMLGKGTPPNVPNIDVKSLREEFLYWYPVDFRNSGKDLVQNHLSFFLFVHAAIFPPEQWPRGIGVNGYVMVDGQKMSKSLGNVIPLRKLLNEFGADATRITILNGGEGVDDPNWDSGFAQALEPKLDGLLQLAQDIGTMATHPHPLDDWLRSNLHETIKSVTAAFEVTNMRTAIQKGFFELSQHIKWYLTRTGDKRNGELVREALSCQIIMIAPFIPHVCEEAWSALGKEGLVAEQSWPVVDETCINPLLNTQEEMVRFVVDEIKRLGKTPPKEVLLFLADDWKRVAYQNIDEHIMSNRNPAKLLSLLTNPALQEKGKELERLVMFLVKGGRTPQHVPSEQEERETLTNAIEYLTLLAKAPVRILRSTDQDHQRATSGMPGRPAVVFV